MIKQYFYEDLLTTNAPIIVHGCNCHGVMGKGVALAIKEKYPKAFKDYQQYCANRYDDQLIGTIVPSVQPDGKIIINAITQVDYRLTADSDNKRYVSYDAVDKCMERIARDLDFKDFLGRVKKERTTLAMPKIGAGLGGGEWTVIAAIIDHRLKDHDVLIYTI